MVTIGRPNSLLLRRTNNIFPSEKSKSKTGKGRRELGEEEGGKEEEIGTPLTEVFIAGSWRKKWILRNNKKKRLIHQDSAQACPHTQGNETGDASWRRT
jgi:hypothetical protein